MFPDPPMPGFDAPRVLHSRLKKDVQVLISAKRWCEYVLQPTIKLHNGRPIACHCLFPDGWNFAPWGMQGGR